MWEKPTPPMMKMPSSAAMTRGRVRAAVNSAALLVAPGCLVDKVVMMSPSALHPRAVQGCPSPAGLLACGSWPSLLPSRSESSSGFIEGQLSAYSCGGSRGFRTFVFHRVPVLRPAECAGTDDGRTIETGLALPQARLLAGASPLTTLPPSPLVRGENDGLLEDEE